MNNINKAQEAYKLSQAIENHEHNIKELKVRLEKHTKENYKATIKLDCWQNWPVIVEADQELINVLILFEHCRLEKATKELDDLLNGNVNKLKECLEGLKYGE